MGELKATAALLAVTAAIISGNAIFWGLLWLAGTERYGLHLTLAATVPLGLALVAAIRHDLRARRRGGDGVQEDSSRPEA